MIFSPSTETLNNLAQPPDEQRALSLLAENISEGTPRGRREGASGFQAWLGPLSTAHSRVRRFLKAEGEQTRTEEPIFVGGSAPGFCIFDTNPPHEDTIRRTSPAFNPHLPETSPRHPPLP